jgi:5-methyltetrahydrofolate--homocysteine methyltransferase
MSNRFTDLLETKSVVLADGATGTNMFALGLASGDAPEFWNVDHPDRVAALHQSFVDAGSDLFLTNSFGGNRHRLKLHKAQERVAELNEAAARIAREVADGAQHLVVVAGSVGPTGELFEPLGPLTMEEAIAAFEEQARALASGGVDVLWVETMSSREEVEAALNGAAVTGLPLVCTLSFDTNGSTMMGITPVDFVALCRELGPSPAAYGTNCGVGPAEVVAGILGLRGAAHDDDLLVAKANCGIPEFVDGAIRYGGTPELMADYARLAVDAGARIVGGCCGTTPDIVRAMRNALDTHTRGDAPSLDTVERRLGVLTAGAKSGNGANRAAQAAARRSTRRRR